MEERDDDLFCLFWLETHITAHVVVVLMLGVKVERSKIEKKCELQSVSRFSSIAHLWILTKIRNRERDEHEEYEGEQ
jgi:hypothetical protein